MRERRLENRIKELCAEALKAEPPELEDILQNLREALHEHNERLRKLAALNLVANEPNPEPV